MNFSGHLIAALWGCIEFQYGEHTQLLRNIKVDIGSWKSHKSGEDLVEATRVIFQIYTCCLFQGHKTGGWLLVELYTVNGTDFGAQECRDSVFFQYVIAPTDLPQNYKGCVVGFSISHYVDARRRNLHMSS